MGVEIMRGCMCVSGCVTRSRALMMKDVYQEPRTRKRSVLPPVRPQNWDQDGSSISFLLTALATDYSQSVLRGSTASVRCRECVTKAVEKIKNEREIIKRKLKKRGLRQRKKKRAGGEEEDWKSPFRSRRRRIRRFRVVASTAYYRLFSNSYIIRNLLYVNGKLKKSIKTLISFS